MDEDGDPPTQRGDVNYAPGQRVYLMVGIMLRADVRIGDTIELGEGRFSNEIAGDVLVIAAHHGIVVLPPQGGDRFHRATGKQTRQTWALMVLLLEGRYGWVVSEGTWPPITSE